LSIVTTEPAQLWRGALRDALLTARKDRDATRVSALRSALGAIDNAETPDNIQVDAPASGRIARSVAGLGAADVARRLLSDAQIRELVRGEVDERLTAAASFSAGGHADRATSLLAETAVLTELLGDV
jgi:uncharacterized protein YqeY